MSIRFKSFIVDFIFLGAIASIALFLISFYFNANFIDTGYPDWLIQAFRIRMLEEYGPISWTHAWSNGINIWQSYQFIPHLLTVFASNLLSSDTTRTMVIMTIGVFVIVRIEIYLALRIIGLSPYAAFIGAMLSFSITHFWGGINEYSLQFAYLFFPIMILLWTNYLRGRLQFIFPFLIGVSIYIHPILLFYSFTLWIVSLFISNRKVFSVSTLIQFLFILIGASLFLYPYFFRDSYKYSNAQNLSKEFLSLVTRNHQFFGVGIILALVLLASTIVSFMPLEKNSKWVRPLTVFCLTSFSLILLANITELPLLLASFQFPRGVTIIGIALCFLGAFLAQQIVTRKNITWNFFLLLFIGYIFVDSVWSSSVFSSKGLISYEDPLILMKQNSKQHFSDRIFTPSYESTSYYFTGKIKLPTSYMSHFDSNQVSPRLIWLGMYAPYANLENSATASMSRIDDYLKTSATRHIIFDKFSPLANALQDTSYGLNYKRITSSITSNGEFLLFGAPWIPVNSALISKELENKLNPFPTNIKFSDSNDYIELDQYVHDFANTIYDERNIILPVSYPSQERISIKIPPNRSSNVVYIAESHSNDWVAIFNGKFQQIKPAGPNYMAVYLSDMNSGGILQLKHSWPKAMIALVVIIIMTPIAILLYNIFFNFKFRRK